jgi:hypothetical protein
MTHPRFRPDLFVETACEKRFQAMLRSAWHKRRWHVIVADPGAGKTMGIRDLITTAGAKAVLALTAPKNHDDEMALGHQLFTALGLPLNWLRVLHLALPFCSLRSNALPQVPSPLLPSSHGLRSTTAPKPATTPIPGQLSAPACEAFIFPHLSMPKRGPKGTLGYHRLFTLI